MAALRRVESGRFSVEDSVSIAQLEQMSAEDRLSRLIPTESLFESLPIVPLPAFYERLCRCGCEIYQNKIKTSFDDGQRVRIYGEGGFFALGEVRAFADGSAIKAIKFFEIY